MHQLGKGWYDAEIAFRPQPREWAGRSRHAGYSIANECGITRSFEAGVLSISDGAAGKFAVALVFGVTGSSRLRNGEQGEAMADLLTVVLSGLLIVHPSGEVNAVRAHHHKLVVQLDGKAHEVRESLSFEGFDSGSKTLTGKLPPDLRQIFTTSDRRLSVDQSNVLTFRVPAGKTSLGGKTQSCTINGVPTVFSLGVVWEGSVGPTSSILIDGRRHSLKGIASIGVSNEYQGKLRIDHLPMYAAFLKGTDLQYRAPVCAVQVFAEPILCPPVSLWP